MAKIVFYYTKYNFIEPDRISSIQFYQLKEDPKLYKKLTRYRYTPISKYARTLFNLLAFPIFTTLYLSNKSRVDLLEFATIVSLYLFICGLYSFPSLFLFWADKKYYYSKLKSDFINSSSYEEFVLLQKSSSKYKKKDIEMIDDTYKNLTDRELQVLYLDKHILQAAPLRLLEKEYEKRQLHIGLPFSKENNPFKNINNNRELKKMVIFLLNNGESIDNIKYYLSELGYTLTKDMLN